MKYAFGFLLIGCALRPAEQRAVLDLDVGIARAGGVALSVRDGLAAVRSADPGNFVLWANAPHLEIDLAFAPDATSDVDLTVQNCLPDAELTSAGSAVDATAQSGSSRTFHLAGTPGATLHLVLGTNSDDAPGAFRFALLSDIQEALPEVGDIYREINEDPSIRFVIAAGDLTSRGTAAELRAFQKKLELLHVPYFATNGNHELGAERFFFHEFFGRATSHFAYRGVHFSLVDSGSATLDPLIHERLGAWLDDDRDRVHVVAMHIPPIDPSGTRNGAFASRIEAEELLGKMARKNVDLELFGHVHSYYAFFAGGVPAFISGGGGAIPERWDGIGRHFMVFDVDSERGVLGQNVVRVDP